MAHIDQLTAQRLSQLQDQIDTAAALTDIALIRSYVNEAAIAYLIAGQPIDFTQLEATLVDEFGTTGKRAERAKEAVAGLRLRASDPSAPQRG